MVVNIHNQRELGILWQSHTEAFSMKFKNNYNYLAKNTDKLSMCFLFFKDLTKVITNTVAVAILLFATSCSYEKTELTLGSAFDRTWDFNSGSNYEFDENLVQFQNGKVVLKALDLEDTANELSQNAYFETQSSAESVTIAVQPKLNSSHVNSILPNQLNDLVAYWRFDGNFSDVSNSSIVHNGSAIGDTHISIESNIGSGSISFDGTADFMRTEAAVLPTVDPLQPVSVCFWIKTTGSNGGIVTQYDYSASSNNLRFGLRFQSGVFSYWKDGVYLASSTALINSGNWEHVCTTKASDGALNIYINGILDGTGSDLNSFQDVPLKVGAFDTTVVVMNGQVDELAIWHNELSHEDVRSLYTFQATNFNELSPSWISDWSDLIGYWKMDGNWLDSSGSGNHGTLLNTPEFDSAVVKIGSNAGGFITGDQDAVNVDLLNNDVNAQTGAITAWVNRSSVNQTGCILCIHSNSTNYIRLVFTDDSGDELRAVYYANPTWRSARFNADIMGANKWHFIAMTWDIPAGELTVYLDGQLMSLETGVSTAIASSFTTSRIGRSGIDTHHYNGKVDDLGVWSDSLSSQEISLIYNRQKQKYASHYDSEVMDLGSATSTWPDLKWVTNLPFGKELVGDFDNDGNPDNDSSLNYVSLSGDLSEGLVGYWSLNEKVAGTAPGATDFKDISGAGNHLTAGGSLVYGEKGILSASFSTNASSSGHAQVNNGINNTSESFTVASWVLIRDINLSAGNRTAVSQQGSAYPAYFVGMDGVSKRPRLSICDSDSPAISCSFAYGPDPFENNRWYFLVGTYNSITQQIQFYVDGVSGGEQSGRAVFNATNKFEIGRSLWNSTITDRWPGSIDEVAVWDRVLTSDEVQQLYRRGANRIKLQVKSCIDPSCNCKSYNVAPAGSEADCDGDGTPNASDNEDLHKAEFIGPGGDGRTYYSELYNRTPADITFNCALNTTDSNPGVCVPDEITRAGSSKPSGPEFFNIDYTQFVTPTTNRYAQYRVYMEADENTACAGEPCLPELTSVSLNPANTVKYASEYVEVNPKSAISFTSIQDASIKADTCASFRLHRNPNTYYHDGTSWVLVGDESHRNIASEVITNIKQFATQFGAGELEVIGYLKSDPTQTNQCSIDEIDINYN